MAQTLSISSLGSGSGLYSDDTRTAAGVTLNGEVSSYQPYFSYSGAPLPSATDDSLIALQIKFGNFYAGSDNNNGVLQLDGTTANSGKSSVKFYTGSAIASGSALASFTSTFRWYMEPYTTTRTPALSLVVVGSNSLVYSLAFVGSGAVANDWNTFTADANTSTWFIYGNGAPGGTVGKTLTEWLADTTYGAILSGGSIVAQGFNIGSSQRLCRVGIDWLESSILNNGNRIDFITPPTVWYVNDNSTTGDVYTTSTGDNANNGSASAPFATIAYAITQASAGDIIRVDAGTYTENVNVNKRVILVGAGIDQTIVTAATGSVPTITVSASGSSVEDRLVIRDMKVTGATGLINPGSGILVQSVSAQSNLTIESVDASFNGGPGIAFNGTPSISDVVIKKSNLSNNANAGIRIASAVASFNGLLVDSCTINNNASIAFSYNPDGNVSNTGTNFTISNTTFNNNSTAGVTNAHDLALFTFRGNATLSNVTVTSGNGSTQNSNSYGISIDGGSGNGPLGTVSLNNVTVQGHVGKGALLFQRYTEISGVSMNNVDLSNCVAPWGQLILSHTDADAFAVGNTTLKSLALWTTGGADATTAQFKNISTGTALDRSVLEDCFQIENQVAHKIDVAALGFARVKAGEVFVTPTSFAAPTTTTPSIQRGVDAATANDIVHVAAGSYTENLNISKSISLLGPNAGVSGYDSARVAEAQILNGKITISGTNTVVVDGMQIYTTTNSPVDLILINSTTSTVSVKNNRIERFGTTAGVIARGLVTVIGITTPVVIEDNFFTGDPSGGLFSGHTTLNNGIFSNGGSNILIKGNKFDQVRTAVNIDNMSAGVTITENIFENNGSALTFGGTTATSGFYNLVGNSFKVFGTIANLSNVTTTFRLDLTGNTFDGKATGDLNLEESFNIERTLFHRGRSSRNGAVTFVPNTQFVVVQNPSISNAITYSEAGGIVQVEAGTFTENVTISKSIDLRGANYGVDPNTGTRSTETILNGTFSLQGNAISVDGFEVTGAGAAFAAGGAGPWSNVSLTNNRMIGKTGQQTVAYGFGLGNVTTSIGAGNWTVSNNRIEDIQATDATALALFNITGLNISNNTILHTNDSFNGRRGLNIDGCQNVVIANNNVDMGLLSPLSDNSDGALTKARYPLQLSASATNRAVSNITVSNNTMGGAYDGIITLGNGTYDSIAITGNEISNNVIGIRFQAGTNTPTGSQSNISILNNSISTSNRPIYLQNGTASSGTADAYNNVTISNNSLLRSSVGAVLEIQAGSILPGGAIAATCNWFGSASDVASKVVGEAVFTPYLVSGTDSDALATGFQPEPGSCIGLGLTALSESTDALCFGGSGSITVTISGGLAPYSINWGTDSVSVSDTSYTISGLAAGMYDISITDSVGTVISLTDTINHPDSLAIEGAIVNQIVCNGGTAVVEISATGGVAPYTGTGEFTVSAGTYTYTVTDANGCSSDVEVVVTEPELLALNSAVVSTEIECFGGSAVVTLVAQGGTAPYTYTFNGDTNATGIFEGVLAGEDLPFSISDASGSLDLPEAPTAPVLSVTRSITDQDDLQAAINAASAGEVIFLANGTYTLGSNLVIGKELALLGESQAGVVIQDSRTNSQSFVTVSANNVTLKDLTIKHVTTDVNIGHAIVASGGGFPQARLDNFRMYNVTSQYSKGGLSVRSDNFVVQGCTFEVVAGSGTRRGILHYGNGGNSFIKDCHFINSTAGALRAITPTSTSGSNPSDNLAGSLTIDGASFTGNLSQFVNMDNHQGASGAFDLIVSNNTTPETNAFVESFGASDNFGDVFGRIVLLGNSLTNNHSSGLGKGILAIDGVGGPRAFRSSTLPVVSVGNTLGQLSFRSGYAEANGSSGSVVGYATAQILPVTVEIGSGGSSCDALTGSISVTQPALLTGTASDDICSDALPYSIFGTELSAAGIYEFTVSAENGCDSVITFTLAVREVTSSTTDLFICESAYPYTWNEEVFTEPGTYLVTLTNAAGCDSLATLNLSTFPGGPAVSTNPVADSRCNRGPVSLSVTPPAGATVDWFTAASGGSLLALGSPTLNIPDLVQTTTYYARSRSTTTGCISSERVAVTASVTAVPVPDGINASRCDEGTLVLTAIPNETFATQRIEWYDQAIGGNLVGTGTTFETPVLSATTSYFAQAIDTIGGCTSISRKEVIAIVSSSPETPTSANDFLRCDPGTLTLSASTATGNATIFWYADSVGGTPLRTFSNTFVTPILSETTVYYAEAISLDLACASPRIPVNATIASIPEDAITMDVSRCGPGVFELSIEAPTGVTADWYTASRGGTLLAEGTLSYTTPELSATTAYFIATRNIETGCTSGNRTRLNAVINPVPAVISTVPGQVCGEGTVNLRAATGVGATIDWFADETATELLVDGGTLRTVTLATPAISSTTTYYARARNTTTGCTSETVAVIASVNDRPTVVESFPGSRCGAGSVELSATASDDAVITWHISAITNSALATGATFNTPLLSASRVYFAQARDTVTGCTSASRTEVLATINPAAATPVAPAVTSSCGSQTVTLTVSVAPGHQISWYESAVGGSPIAENTESVDILVEQSTYYAESISESTGCVSARVPVTITFTNAPPAPLGTDGSVCVSGRVSLSAAALPGNVVRWYSVATGGSILATGDTYLTPSLTETTVFYAESFNTSTGCVSTSRTAVNAVVNANPAPFETATFESCGPGEVALALTAEQGITADWYTRFSGGDLLAEGTLSYTTPVLSATTLYYAAARNSATGCISTRVAVIAQINALPLVTATVPGTVCGEGSASLRASAGAGATIDWFADEACTELLVDGGTLRTVILNTPSINVSTTYYARARNTTSGCLSAPVAVSATVSDRPTVVESFPGSRCGAGSVELSATASDNAVITWHISAITTSTLFTGSTYNTPSIAGSRVYFAQARDTITGCTSLSRTEVAATVNPAAALPVAQGSTSSCGQDSITLTVSVAAGHQIFWFAEAEGGSAIAENTNSILVSTSGQLTYYAESISENTGCVSARTPVTIIINDALDAPTGVDGAICVRGRVSLSATAPAGAVVRWFSVAEGGTVLSTANTYLTPTLTETTVYYAESFNSSTGCISQVRTPVTATVNANPAPLASVTIGRCGPGTVELTVESPAGITADWYTASRGGSPIAVNTLSYTTPSISSTTNYFVAARDLSTGCVSARVSVRAQINPFPAVLETVPGSVCGEGTATLRATTATGSTIDWFADEACTELLLDGGTLRIVPFITPVISANTTFYARARNRTTGCLSAPVAVAATVNARPEILAVYDGLSCSSGSVLLSVDVSPNATADWFATPTTTTRLVTGSTLYLTPVISSSRTYYAVARNVFTGCTSSRVAVQAVIDASACKVDDTVVDDQTEIENDPIEEPSLRLDVDYQLKAYPNPTTGLTQVEWISKEADKVYIRLYNSLGQIAYEYTDFAETGINVYRIDLSDVSQGMYYLSITNGKDVIKTQPLVKN